MTTKFFKCLDENDVTGFLKEWERLKPRISETKKRELLCEIVEYYYDDRRFGFFKKVFDALLYPRFNLDFYTDDWAPTLLSGAVNVPSRRLFDYFLKKGATLNFIADTCAGKPEKYIQTTLPGERYETCLDFANTKYADMFQVDYVYQPPKKNSKREHWSEIDNKEEITVNKQYYHNLLEQSQYLHDLVHLDKLINHIKGLGGKTFNELAGKPGFVMPSQPSVRKKRLKKAVTVLKLK